MGVGGSRGHRGRIDANNYSGRMEGVYITRNTIPYGKETIARNGKLFGIYSIRLGLGILVILKWQVLNGNCRIQ